MILIITLKNLVEIELFFVLIFYEQWKIIKKPR